MVLALVYGRKGTSFSCEAGGCVSTDASVDVTFFFFFLKLKPTPYVELEKIPNVSARVVCSITLCPLALQGGCDASPLAQ